MGAVTRADTTGIGPMISAHLHAIADQLAFAKTGQRRATGLPPDPPSDDMKAAPVGDSTFLSLDDGIRLKSGSWIFAPVEGEDPSWCVLSSVVDDATGSADYLMKGELAEDLDTKAFLSEAYRLLLDREIDSEGLRAYSAMLNQRRASRFEVLQTVAASDEALARAQPLIIVPKTMIDTGPA